MSEFNIDQFVINKEENDLVDGDVIAIGYGVGAKSVSPTSNQCLCKQCNHAGKSRFFVRVGMNGPQAGQLYDPQTADAGALERQDDFVGRGRYEFRPVSEVTYGLYLNFLQTGNPSLLRQAEREYRAQS